MCPIITLVGDGMRTSQGIASKFFASLAEVNVNIVAIAQGSSERAISAVIPEDKVSEAIKACHETLFNSIHYLGSVCRWCRWCWWCSGGSGSASAE